MGKLVIFEGLDGSGKGTQTALTAKNLEAQGLELQQITFPDYESDSSTLKSVRYKDKIIRPIKYI